MTIADIIAAKYPKPPIDIELHHAAIREIMESDPTITSIVIKGHTPSFNDGDPCTHREEVLINGVDEYGYAEDGNRKSSTTLNAYLYRAIEAVEWIRVGHYGTDFKLTYDRQPAPTLDFKHKRYNPEW